MSDRGAWCAMSVAASGEAKLFGWRGFLDIAAASILAAS